jgi:hypothetical protein
MSELLPDEACHLTNELRLYTLRELRHKDLSGVVKLHNTMRFDVQLAYIQAMLDYGELDKQDLTEAISNAIVGAVEEVIGNAFGGVPFKSGAQRRPVKRSKMLHRETICFDVS